MLTVYMYNMAVVVANILELLASGASASATDYTAKIRAR